MSELSAQITITAVDKVSNVVKGIGKEFSNLKSSVSGLGAAWGNVSKAGSEFGAKLRNLSLVTAGAGAAIVGLAEHYAEYSHQLLLSQQRTGVSAENLQKLAYSAKLSGVGTDQLNTSLRFLNKNIDLAATNAKSPAAKAFASMGISVKDASGKMKDANTVMLEMSDKFKKNEDGAKKVKTALDTMGRSGTALIPVLNQGSEAIKNQGDEYAKLHGILTGSQLEANAAFEKSMVRLKEAVSGLGATVASALIPVLQPIVDGMTKWIVANRDWLAKDIKENIVALGHALSDIWSVLKAIGVALLPVIDAFGGLKTVVAALAGIYIASLIVSFTNLVSAVYGLGAAFFALDLAIAPILGIVAAIALIGFAIYELITHFDEFKSAFISLWGQLPSPVQEAMKLITSVATLGISNIVLLFTNLLPTMKSIGTELLDAFLPSITSALNSLGGLFSWIEEKLKGIGSAFGLIKAPSIPSGSSSLNSPSSGGSQGISLGAPPTNRYSMLSNSQPQTQKLDINMSISADGRVQNVKATSNAPIDFKANTGKMI